MAYPGFTSHPFEKVGQGGQLSPDGDRLVFEA